MGEFSLNHWLVVLVVGVVVFGPNKLPELGKSLGRSLAAFKKGLKEGLSDDESRDAGAADRLSNRIQ